MLVRRLTPLKLASSSPARSRKLKSPFLILTRRTSGATATLGCCVRDLLSTATWTGDEVLADVAATTGAASFWMNSFSACDLDTLAACFGETAGDCASCEPGNLHFPSASWGQTTLGSMSETSLTTSLREKSERNRTRSRNVFASRKYL